VSGNVFSRLKVRITITSSQWLIQEEAGVAMMDGEAGVGHSRSLRNEFVFHVSVVFPFYLCQNIAFLPTQRYSRKPLCCWCSGPCWGC